MNEEIEYAEMLEIPVSTVNIVRKNQRRKKVKAQEHSADATQNTNVELPAPPLKDSVIAQVNDRLNEPSSIPEEAPVQEEIPLETIEEAPLEGRLHFDPIPERIDTMRLYSSEETNAWRDSFREQDYNQETQNEGGRYALNYKKRKINA